MTSSVPMQIPMQNESGVLLIDKPSGISSFQVVKAVSRITGIRKAGHAGTLDPMATGLLVVCLGRATRITRFIMQGVKEYQGVMRLGVATDTYDSQGRVISSVRLPSGLGMEQVSKAASKLTGRLLQPPPPFSAAKHKGVPLYRLARRGEMVEKEPKEIVVHEFSVEDAGFPDIRFSITCSRGTYVRSLCHELGKMLGCGAHMTALGRTRCGELYVDRALGLDELERVAGERAPEEIFLSVNDALGHLPAVRITQAQASRLRLGQGLSFDEFMKASEEAGISGFDPSGFPEDVERENIFVRLVTEDAAGQELAAVARPCRDERGRLVTEKICI